jgi:uncharacterized membrane-anchored protein
MQFDWRTYSLLSVVLSLIFLDSSGKAQVSPTDSPADNRIHWMQGPGTAKLGNNAEVEIPKGFLFTDGTGARKYMELAQNPTSGSELGLIAPKSENETWFVLFEFGDVGFVKDDDKSSLDESAILKTIQDATEKANEERRKRNWKAFHVSGWHTLPYYDSLTNNLTWAVNGSEDNNENSVVNYSVRVLGRRGTMNVNLVLDPKDLISVEPQFKQLMSGFRFTGGNRYADFVQGDKLAGYGLTALIAGGATAVAIKTGLFAKLWKFLILAIAAIAAWLKKLWSKTKSVVTGERDPKDEFPPVAKP